MHTYEYHVSCYIYWYRSQTQRINSLLERLRIVGVGWYLYWYLIAQLLAKADIEQWPSWICESSLHRSWQSLLEDIQRWRPGWDSGQLLEKINTKQLNLQLFHQVIWTCIKCYIWMQCIATILPLLSISGVLRKRKGPWETKCTPVSIRAALLRRWCGGGGGIHPLKHLVSGFPASHRMTEQLMYTWTIKRYPPSIHGFT